jgi:hypothetical protein
MLPTALVLAAFAVTASLPLEAKAAPLPPASVAICAGYVQHVRYLTKMLGEVPAFKGSIAKTISLHVFVNRSTGSWTALLVRSDGLSCVKSLGDVSTA